MKERIQNDIKEALKAGEEIKVGTLRMVLAFLINKEKDLPADRKGKELSDEEVMDVLQTEAKKRREAIEAFEKGGRPELAEKEKKELEILKTYLPEQLSAKEIQDFVTQAIEKTGATSMQDR
ncbi:GatB/YqeY domain-containing protein, partial [Patescibacteria group bacterium]|nr:GatB/YqeY domain-containing protein [Patescibacteria group bacterium]